MTLHGSQNLDRLAKEISELIPEYSSTYQKAKHWDEVRSDDSTAQEAYTKLHEECGRLRDRIIKKIDEMRDEADGLFG